jgi:hypothetical protein
MHRDGGARTSAEFSVIQLWGLRMATDEGPQYLRAAREGGLKGGIIGGLIGSVITMIVCFICHYMFDM